MATKEEKEAAELKAKQEENKDLVIEAIFKGAREASM